MSWLDKQDPAKVQESLEAAREVEFRGMLRYAGGDERYALWLLLADRRCLRKVGVGIFDLCDWTWADAYENGTSPSDAVEEALMEDDLYASLFRE